MESITKIDAIKQYFADARPLTNAELLDLRKNDPEGYDEIAQLCANALGATLKPTASK